MRKAITVLALVVLAGCTTSGLEKDQPAYSGMSAKTPQQLAQCLGPKWQAYNSLNQLKSKLTLATRLLRQRI